MEGTSTMKKCTKCGEEKPATTKFFPKKKNGLYSWCKVCKNTAGREWNKKNAAYYKKWRKDNLERKNQTDKEWKKNNPDKTKAAHSKSYAKKKGVKILHDVYPSQVLEKWGTDCHICNEPVDLENWEMEHVIPTTHPGCTHTLDNIKPAHRSCNSKKGTSL